MSQNDVSVSDLVGSDHMGRETCASRGAWDSCKKDKIRHWGLGIVIHNICNVYNRAKPSRTINQLKKKKKEKKRRKKTTTTKVFI